MNKRAVVILVVFILTAECAAVIGLIYTAGVLLSRPRDDYRGVASRLPYVKDFAQADGVPLTSAEIQRKPPVPESQNAAVFYRKIAEMAERKHNPDNDKLEKEALALLKKPGDRAAIKKARKLLELYRPELELAAQAVQRPDCDFHRNFDEGARLPLPEMGKMRLLGRLLTLRSELQAEAGDLPGAFQTLSQCGRIGRHSGSDPILISMLVQIAIESIAHKQWISLVKRYGKIDLVLSYAEAADREIRPTPDPVRALPSEVILAEVELQHMREGKPGIPEATAFLERFPPANRQLVIDSWEVRELQFWRKYLTAAQSVHGDLLELYQQQKGEDSRLPQIAEKPTYEIFSVLMPTLSEPTLKAIHHEAENSLRQTTLSLLRYRNKTGRFPSTLSELKQSVPKDPFTRKRLLYRVEGTGFRLYSVGENFRDDGGVSEKKIKDKSTRPDIVVNYP